MTQEEQSDRYARACRCGAPLPYLVDLCEQSVDFPAQFVGAVALVASGAVLDRRLVLGGRPRQAGDAKPYF